MMFLNKRMRPATGTLEIGDPDSGGAMGRRRRVQSGGMVFDQVDGPGGGTVEPVRQVPVAAATMESPDKIAPLKPGEWSMPVTDEKAGGVILGRFADPARQGGVVAPSRLNWSRAAESLAGVGGTLADAAIRPPDQAKRAAFLAERTPVHVQGNTKEADREERLAGVDQGRRMARERQRYVEPVEVQGQAAVAAEEVRADAEKHKANQVLSGQGVILEGQKYAADKTLEGLGVTGQTQRDVETTRAGADKYKADKIVEGQGIVLQGQKYAADKALEGGKYAADKTVEGQGIALQGQKYAADKALEGGKYAADKTVEGQKYVADAPGKSAKELRELDARTAAEFREEAKAQGGMILPPGVQYVAGATPVKVRQDGVSRTGKPVQREVFVDPRTNQPMRAASAPLEDDPVIAAARGEIKRQADEMAGGDNRTGWFNRKSRETVIAEQEAKIAARKGELIRQQYPDAKLVKGRWIVERDGKQYAVGE